MITWVPWNPELPDVASQTGFLMRDIAVGAHDGYIADIASEVAEWDGPIFIRFAQEMNGTWYPWGKHQNSPDEYVAAWRHVHQIFDEHGAGHVTWVWNASEKNHPESLSLWYPGDDVVDWVAVDGYNWDAPQYWRQGSNTWRLLDQVFRPSFDDINELRAGRQAPDDRRDLDQRARRRPRQEGRLDLRRLRTGDAPGAARGQGRHVVRRADQRGRLDRALAYRLDGREPGSFPGLPWPRPTTSGLSATA